jgi:hypothetical protein
MMKPSGFPKLRWWWIGLALLCALASFEYLNFTGFCYSQKRYLGDEELLGIAVMFDIARYNESREEFNKKYRSLEEFNEINPKCCVLYRSSHLIPDAVFSRILGYFVSVAEISYQSSDSTRVDRFYYSLVYMDACGKVVDWTGIRESQP